MSHLKGKTIVITGGSRGIGQAIALRYAAAKASLVILSKDTPAALQEVEEQIMAAGGKALVLSVDISDQTAMKQAVSEAAQRFGGIDALVNNTSATCFASTLHISPEQFDLVIATSVRAAFFMAKTCVPYLKKATNPHIINISPPLTIDPHWFKDHLAFSLGKYGMSLCTLGMAAEFHKDGIAVNSLWPKTTIATQTIQDHFLPQVYAGSRWPSIMADAAYELVLRLARMCTGRFWTDEELLKEAGITDLSHYAVDPKSSLMQSLFLPLEEGRLPVAQELFLAK